MTFVSNTPDERVLAQAMRSPKLGATMQVAVSASLGAFGAHLWTSSSHWTEALSLAIVTGLWMGIAVFRGLDLLRPIPVFFRGAPPRLGIVDVVVGSSLLIHLWLDHAMVTAYVLGLAASISQLRLLRWLVEWRAMPWSLGTAVRRVGLLTGIGDQIGWSSRSAPFPLSLTTKLREGVEVDYRRNAEPVELPSPQTVESTIAALETESLVRESGGPSPLPGPERHAPGAALLFLAPLLGVIGAYKTQLILLPSLVLGAWVVLGFWRRTGSHPGTVLIVESPVSGAARWVPLMLTWAVATAASWNVTPMTLGRYPVELEKFLVATLTGLVWTFFADRLTRAGVVAQRGSGANVLEIHGSTVEVTSGRTVEGAVWLDTAVGAVRVTWPGLYSLETQREFGRALVSILTTGPGARVDPRRGFLPKPGPLLVDLSLDT
jgi:hypothetical protein